MRKALQSYKQVRAQLQLAQKPQPLSPFAEQMQLMSPRHSNMRGGFKVCRPCSASYPMTHRLRGTWVQGGGTGAGDTSQILGSPRAGARGNLPFYQRQQGVPKPTTTTPTSVQKKKKKKKAKTPRANGKVKVKIPGR